MQNDDILKNILNNETINDIKTYINNYENVTFNCNSSIKNTFSYFYIKIIIIK